ncbi:MAG TPA: hypothetical protein VFO65_06135, partial [Acidimicrobiales bacterium]|nr:hypothetical protein [Acidimicrobiales bacterium]
LNLPAALLAPSKVQLANIAAVSDYTVPAAPVAVAAAPFNPAAPVDPPAATLPRTGGPANLALFGGLAAVLGMGMRRFIRIPSLRPTKE